jgi:hypothetical protein
MRATAVLLLFIAAPAAAQVQTRATDPPSVTAVNESWFRLGEPLQLGGELYFRAGATVFFDGNRMARIGHYNGIPLYADTTVEPYSVVLVPVTRGLLQPYERPRRGELAGTTGSGAPAFPVYPVPASVTPTAAATPPTGLPAPIGAVSAFTQDPAAVAVPARVDTAAPGTPAPETGDARAVASLLRPESNDGVWIQFEDRRWVSAGAAVPLAEVDFVRVGDYKGFPVFRRRFSSDEAIYLPTRAGLAAPYRPR